MRSVFKNREEAADRLIRLPALRQYSDRSDAVVLALPRGGVPIAAKIAKALHLPMDVLIARKIGLPGHEEFAIGAIAPGNVCYLNHWLINRLNIPSGMIESIKNREQIELQRREKSYHSIHLSRSLENKIVLLVDDGIATGATVRAAIQFLKVAFVSKIMVVTPTIAFETARELEKMVDALISIVEPTNFGCVAEWYEDFPQVSDAAVLGFLATTSKKSNV